MTGRHAFIGALRGAVRPRLLATALAVGVAASGAALPHPASAEAPLSTPPLSPPPATLPTVLPPQSPPQSPPPPGAAAGVLETDGRRACSAVLIAPDTVATAAHCIGGRTLSGQGGESRINFHTGAYPGHPSVMRTVTRALTHPLYSPAAQAARDRMAADIALLTLDAPIGPADATPIPPGDPVGPGERLLIASWPGGSGERARERRCPAVTTGPKVATLSCIVRAGESGAPVVRSTPDGLRLAAIVVATSRAGHQPFAFTVQARTRLRQLHALYTE